MSGGDSGPKDWLGEFEVWRLEEDWRRAEARRRGLRLLDAAIRQQRLRGDRAAVERLVAIRKALAPCTAEPAPCDR